MPAVWDFYDEAVPLVQTVHNLEHGGVVILYGPAVPEGRRGEDPRVVRRGPERPARRAARVEQGQGHALGAWTAPDASTGTRDRGRGWLATGTKFDKDAFDAFVDAHRYEGPERLLPEQLAPGRLAVHPPGWRNWQTRST